MTKTGRPPPILPPDASFGHNLRVTNRLIQRDLGTRVVRMGLNLGQWYALRTLWESDGLTQIDLAQRSGIAGPAMVTAVRGLRAMGLVRRRRHPEDKRKYVIRLTDKGWALQNDALAAAVEANDLALNGIPHEDVATCLRVLAAAHANLCAKENALDPTADEADRLPGVTVP
jgi:DNA-binding MarR family transcriptional regulator